MLSMAAQRVTHVDETERGACMVSWLRWQMTILAREHEVVRAQSTVVEVRWRPPLPAYARAPTLLGTPGAGPNE